MQVRDATSIDQISLRQLASQLLMISFLGGIITHNYLSSGDSIS